MNYNEMSLRLHEEHGGKLEVVSKVPVKNRDDLELLTNPIKFLNMGILFL